MIKRSAVCIFLLLAAFKGIAQADSSITKSSTDSPSALNEGKEVVYKIKPAVDIPLLGVTGGWSGYALTKIYNKDPSTEAQINSLNKNNINGFDRWAVDRYSEQALNNSNLFFYGSMPLPLLFLADRKVRKDFVKVGFLYVEAMCVTGILYTGAVYFKDKYRPLAYNPEVPMNTRLRGGAKNSFFAGHVALVGTSAFFMAKVYADYHPESRIKWVFYTAAAGATGATGYLRHRAGQHFPSDVLIGTAVGTLSGLLVPHFHKNQSLKDSKINLVPFGGTSNGVALLYKF